MSRFVRPLLAACLLIPFACALYAQTLGTVTGEVRDASGASVAGAAITVRNTATNVVRNVVTNEEGVYNVPALNPGHLIADDEWMHTPIRPGSTERIASGMLFQCDIIPAPLPDGYALNCEDTVAIADAGLRAALEASYPDLWCRVELRRRFMREALGFEIADDLLPLSSAPAYLPPFWLQSDLACFLAAQ